MMKTHAKLLLLLSALYSNSYSQSDDTEVLIETKGAIASFSNNGIDGSVKVINGHIILNLTFEDNFDWNEFGSSSECLTGGLYFGIYDSWEFTDYKDRKGSDSCNYENVGYRWDPWMACSTSSSNENCISNDGCVPPYSEKWNADEYEYICNEYSYLTNPYICEIGDLSGKYGLLQVSETDSNDDNYKILTSYSSAFEVDSYDLGGKSILFRCHDNTRAFCSGFTTYKPSDTELENYVRPFQEVFYEMDEIATDDPSDNVYSMRAQFGDSGNSYVLLTYYGHYEIVLDSSDINVPGGCGNEIYYRIFTSWDDSGSDCEEKTSDNFWDPTIVCADNSENGDTNGKGYCLEDYYLCEDSSWEYECNDYTDDLTHRITCAPGDLSAKYGAIDIKNNVNFKINFTGEDTKMPPMAKLVGKSMVLQCSSDKAIIDCAGFSEYYDDMGFTNNNDITDDDDNNNGKSNKKNKNGGDDDTFLGVSSTVVIIMAVLGIAALVPCIRGCRNRKLGIANGNEETMDDVLEGGKKNTKDNSTDGRYNGGTIRQQSTSRTDTNTGAYKGRTVPSMQQALAM